MRRADAADPPVPLLPMVLCLPAASSSTAGHGTRPACTPPRRRLPTTHRVLCPGTQSSGYFLGVAVPAAVVAASGRHGVLLERPLFWRAASSYQWLGEWTSRGASGAAYACPRAALTVTSRQHVLRGRCRGRTNENYGRLIRPAICEEPWKGAFIRCQRGSVG